MLYNQVFLYSFGYELPPNVLSSDALEERLAPVYERLKMPAGRLELMTGIRERRLWSPGAKPSHGAIKAGAKALAASGISPAEIDCLIFCAVSRDMMEPATAAFVHNSLGLPEECLVFDLSNACLGFLNGMILLANMIELGQIRKGMVVASETAESLIESTITRLTADQTLTRKSIKPSFASLTIGSGAVALIMGGEGHPHARFRLAGGTCGIDSAHNHLCQGGPQGQAGILMATDSEELMLRGVETARRVWQRFLHEMKWRPESIARFFCHQVGSVHARFLFDTLALPLERNFETLSWLGNVGSVSAPLTMAMGLEKGLLTQNDRTAMLGIGSGINCFMLGLEHV